jgi:hypothetical protein
VGAEREGELVVGGGAEVAREGREGDLFLFVFEFEDGALRRRE